MRRLLAAAAVIAFTTPAMAQVRVDGHTRRDGTYVAPHYRTAPDSSRTNNWSSQGNTNPMTGQQGTVNPYGVQPSPSPYGGQYNNPYGSNRR